MLTHVWGLLAHPQSEWEHIGKEGESVQHLYAHHVFILAAVPVISAYIGTTQIGWGFGGSHPFIKLDLQSALYAGIAFYICILAAVFLIGTIIYRMARRVSTPPDHKRCVIFAGYVATPMLLSGLVAVYPLVWICLLAGIIGLCVTAYVLYVGTPYFLGIDSEEGFIVSSATLVVGVLVLEAMLAITVILWGYGEVLLPWLFRF